MSFEAITPPPPKPTLYKIPFVEQLVSHEDIFTIHGNDPIFYRPADVERIYGIPVSTISDLISEQPTTQFPAFKVTLKDGSKRALIFIPKRALDEWLVEHSNLTRYQTQNNNN